MAYPSTEVANFRGEVTRTVAAMRRINTQLAIIDDQGADDPARAAFFQNEFGPDSNNPDITWPEFVAAVVALRNLQTAWEANRIALSKALE